MKKIYNEVFVFTIISNSLFYAANYEWGKTGHRTTGAIAEQYLSKKAKKKTPKLLKGQLLTFVSTYADEVNYLEASPRGIYTKLNFNLEASLGILNPLAAPIKSDKVYRSFGL